MIRKPSIICVIILLASILGSEISLAQEMAIPLCGDIKSLDSRVGLKMDFFKDFPEFQQATLSRFEDNYFLNITYIKDGIFQNQRKAISQDELKTLCEQYNEVIQFQNDFNIDENISEEARRRFVLSAAAFSTAYYGWAIPGAFNIKLFKSGGDYFVIDKRYVASYLIIGGTGFFVPLIATRNKEITNGMERAFTSGALLGIYHGKGIGMLIQGNDLEYETQLGLSVGVSIAEGLTGYYLAKKYNYTWGRSGILGTGGMWGLVAGATLPLILFNNQSDRVYGFSMLAFSAAGIAGANYLFNNQPFSIGDATFINSTGVLGAYYSIVLTETFNIKNQRPILGGVLLGAAAGLTYGINKTKHYNYTRQQANLIALGETAGWLIGLGTVALTDAGDDGFFWLTALGATGGLFLTNYLVKNNISTSLKKTSNLKMQINPWGVMGAIDQKQIPYTHSDPRYFNSIVNINYSF
jgi:hypothetical protein